jgi:hypothetical protein
MKSLKFTFTQISSNIRILNKHVVITNKVESGGLIYIYADYTANMINETIQLHFSPGEIVNITYNPTVPALFYTQEECNVSTQV